MTSIRVSVLFKIILFVVMIDWLMAAPMIEEDVKLSDIRNQLTEAEEREVLDNLVSYIIARKVLGLHSPETMYEMQKKRSYWKLCAVNAVSCFGKK